LFTPVTINGVEIKRCVLDTGATQSVMSRQTISKIIKNTSTFIKDTGQPTKIKIANGDIADCMFTEKCQVIVGPRDTKLSIIIMEQDTHTLQGLNWFRQTNCEVNSSTGKMTFHKDDDMTAYQFIVPEDENEIQTYVAEIDEEELNEFASWEDEPKTPIQINNNNLSESEKTDIINTIISYIFADH
jgi:predicted aspartyl protease